ncbi:MAG: hypothetical protein ACREDD_07980 [Methylocella sp.]
MEPGDFGIEQVTQEDRAYNGSRFSEVREAIFANPYQQVWGREGEPPLPHYEVTKGNMLRGILPFAQHYYFAQGSKRTIDSHADLRWGPDKKGFRRIIHSNGVCLTGLWEITEETEYSGYFRGGSRGLVIGRYSSGSSGVHRGDLRVLALAGKLFPTTDPNHALPLHTANLVTIEDIGGTYTAYINDAELRNAPEITVWRQLFLVIPAIVFTLIDKVASTRQAYPIAELGKPLDEPTRAPEFIRLLVAPDQPRIEGEKLDLRDEVLSQIFDKGDPVPKRKLTFHIEVTDEGKTRFGFGSIRPRFENWRRIGKLTFDDAVASYNGDFVIHFNHPTWRADRNNPATANRAAISRA